MRRAKIGDTVCVTCKVVTQDDGQDAGLFENDETTFVCGNGRGVLMPFVDDLVKNMRIGETKRFVVRADDQSHPQSVRDESLVRVIHLSRPEIKSVRVGALTRASHRGRMRLAKVTRIDRDKASITLDMNDPLSGRALEGTITLNTIDSRSNIVVERAYPKPIFVGGRTFDLESLSRHDGKTRPEICISVLGYVYDVSSGRKFYGPGGMYGALRASDATVALAKFRLDSSLLNMSWTGLNASERETLRHFVVSMNEKYPCVGILLDGEL